MKKEERQQMFDTIIEKMVEQRVPSVNKDGYCVYRGPNGTKCAVGHLITDDEYSEEMESAKASDVAKHIERFYDHRFFLQELQHCHDKAVDDANDLDVEFLPIFISKMRRAAYTYELTFPENLLNGV